MAVVHLHCCVAVSRVATCHITRAHNGQAEAVSALDYNDNMRVGLGQAVQGRGYGQAAHG